MAKRRVSPLPGDPALPQRTLEVTRQGPTRIVGSREYNVRVTTVCFEDGKPSEGQTVIVRADNGTHEERQITDDRGRATFSWVVPEKGFNNTGFLVMEAEWMEAGITRESDTLPVPELQPDPLPIPAKLAVRATGKQDATNAAVIHYTVLITATTRDGKNVPNVQVGYLFQGNATTFLVEDNGQKTITLDVTGLGKEEEVVFFVPGTNVEATLKLKGPAQPAAAPRVELPVLSAIMLQQGVSRLAGTVNQHLVLFLAKGKTSGSNADVVMPGVIVHWACDGQGGDVTIPQQGSLWVPITVRTPGQMARLTAYSGIVTAQIDLEGPPVVTPPPAPKLEEPVDLAVVATPVAGTTQWVFDGKLFGATKPIAGAVVTVHHDLGGDLVPTDVNGAFRWVVDPVRDAKFVISPKSDPEMAVHAEVLGPDDVVKVVKPVPTTRSGKFLRKWELINNWVALAILLVGIVFTYSSCGAMFNSTTPTAQQHQAAQGGGIVELESRAAARLGGQSQVTRNEKPTQGRGFFSIAFSVLVFWFVFWFLVMPCCFYDEAAIVRTWAMTHVGRQIHGYGKRQRRSYRVRRVAPSVGGAPTYSHFVDGEPTDVKKNEILSGLMHISWAQFREHAKFDVIMQALFKLGHEILKTWLPFLRF